MKKILIIIWLCAMCMVSCSTSTTPAKENVTLLNNVFLELIGTDYYNEEPPLPPMPLEYAKTKQDSIEFFQKQSKLKEALEHPQLDTIDLVIGVAPFYINPKQEFRYWDTKDSLFPRAYYSDAIASSDFDQLFIALVDSTQYQKSSFDVHQLNDTGKYQIKDLSELEKEDNVYWKSSSYRYVASMYFSDIKMNKTQDKAIFYVIISCGELCGSGRIVFCVKEEGHWKVIERDTLWVS